MKLHHGDCIEILPTLPAESVHAIITDLPYGTTQAEWDSVIPFDFMWSQVNRLLVSNGVFITTASQPFTSDLINSNRELFKYEIIWKKTRASGHLDARRKPMKIHENILVFSKGQTTYNPQFTKGEKYISKHKGGRTSDLYGSSNAHVSENAGVRFPVSVVEFTNEFDNQHPTQKPTSLFQYLIMTYTNAGDTVLDFVMGSGTTGVSCVQTGRNFIGIEKEKKYFELAKSRIMQAPTPLFTESLRLPTPLAPDGGDSPRQQALFSPEADSPVGDVPAPAPRR